MRPRKNDYRSESPRKKQARLMELNLLKEAMGKEAFEKGPHLVIAGHEAGHISTMIGLGVEPAAIYAVDTDIHALAASEDRFGSWGVNFKRIDFRDAHKAFSIRVFASAVIDLCSYLTDKDIKAVIQLKARFKTYGFQVNREKGLVGVFTQSLQDGGKSVKARLEYLAFKGFKTGFAIHYVSETLTNKGTPMCIAFCKNVRRPLKKPEVFFLEWDHKDLDRKIRSATSNTYLLYNLRRQAVAGKKAARTRNEAKIRGRPE